jgi:uncharacterized protein (TIGR02246 family)
MRTRSLSAILVILLIAPFVPHASVAAPSEQDAVKGTVSAFIDGFNQHDPHAVARLFDEDADFSNIRNETTHGREAIERLYVGLFTGRLRDAHRTASVQRVRLLTPEIAIVDADWEMTGAKTEAGSELPPLKGILILVMTKRAENWSITSFHEPLMPPPPTK